MRDRFANIRIDSKLWKDFGSIVKTNRDAGLIAPENTRSSLLRDFIKSYIAAFKKVE